MFQPLPSAFVCATCARPFEHVQVGQWKCRAHPGTVDSLTRRYTCCGLTLAAIAEARGPIRGCAAADHRPADDVAPEQLVPLFVWGRASCAADDDDDAFSKRARAYVYRTPAFWASLAGGLRENLEERARASARLTNTRHLGWGIENSSSKEDAPTAAKATFEAPASDRQTCLRLVHDMCGWNTATAAERAHRDIMAELLTEDRVPVTLVRVARMGGSGSSAHSFVDTTRHGDSNAGNRSTRADHHQQHQSESLSAGTLH